MNSDQKSNLLSIFGGVCFAVNITYLITNKSDYSIIHRAILLTGLLLFWIPSLFILFKIRRGPLLNDTSRRNLIVRIILSSFISALIVYATPILDKVNSIKKVSLELTATALSNPQAMGSEIGILAVSMDGTMIPWSEFEWKGNWDKIESRPYFHDVHPAKLTWQGYNTNHEGVLSLSLYSHPASGILLVQLNGTEHAIDLYEDSSGSIKQVDYLIPQRDWSRAAFFLIFTLVIGILIFIVTAIPLPFLVISLTLGAVILNLTVFQKTSPLPAPRLLSTNELDQVAVTDQLWAINDRYIGSTLAVYFYPALHGTTLISTPELILELAIPDLKYTPERVGRLLSRLLALKACNYFRYDYLLSRDELDILEQGPSLKWDISNGGKYVVVPESQEGVYVLMKSSQDALSYYFVPIEIVSKLLKRDFQ